MRKDSYGKQKEESMINLGDTVKDSISGFTGIATARSKFLHGCIRIFVEPNKLTKDGTTIDGKWFDEPQLTVTKKSKAAKVKPAHGPRNDAPTGR